MRQFLIHSEHILRVREHVENDDDDDGEMFT